MLTVEQGVMDVRSNRLSWDDHHMLLAMVTAQRSCDPNTQVGACIISRDNRVLGLGYNNPPRGINCSQIPWERDNNDPLKTKYPFIVHAEKNAIHNASASVHKATLYTTMFPCNECTKDIIQAGIKRVVYLNDPHADTWECKASRTMLSRLDVGISRYSPSADSFVTKQFTRFVESFGGKK